MSVSINPSSQTDPVGWLKRDHQIIRGYLEQLDSDSKNGRRQTLDSLKKILALHNAIEENLVYPTLAEVAGKREQAFELFHQTAEADILVYDLEHALLENDQATFASLASELHHAILEHVHIEETQAFPLLESASPADLQALGRQIIQFKQTVTTP